MSIDRTLKQQGGILRNRSVLTRAERITQLTNEGKFDPDKDRPFGLPKVRVKHSKAGTKTKKAAEETAAAVAGEAQPAGGEQASAATPGKAK